MHVILSGVCDARVRASHVESKDPSPGTCLWQGCFDCEGAARSRCSFSAQHDNFSFQPIQILRTYHTRQALALTIFCPDLQLKACSNSAMFDTTLSMRNTGREWGSVVTAMRAISGRMLVHHE